MPAFGSSAVPFPTKIRKTLPGCHIADAFADACGDLTADATGALTPVTATRDTTPRSRRATANAANSTGAPRSTRRAAALDCATAAPDFTDDTWATDDTRATDPRAARGPAFTAGAEVDAAEAAEPLDPAEPVESADANGIDATAAPTPRATANKPTRPTYRA